MRFAERIVIRNQAPVPTVRLVTYALCLPQLIPLILPPSRLKLLTEEARKTLMELVAESAAIWRNHGAEVSIWAVSAGEVGTMVFDTRYASY